jgi:threonine/homoserine/homoserine lactone efflux protein
MLAALIAFALAASLLTITPGLDTAIVLRAVASGPRSGAAAALGVCAGLLVWGAAAALGLGALLAASPAAYVVLKGAGAAYLIFVGVKLLLWPRAAFEPTPHAGASRGALWRGFLTNVLNPKVGVFYATFLPQFVPPGAPVAAFCLVLTGVHAALAAGWFAALIALTQPLGRALRRASVVRALDRLTGGVFVAFGAKLAISRI